MILVTEIASNCYVHIVCSEKYWNEGSPFTITYSFSGIGARILLCQQENNAKS